MVEKKTKPKKLTMSNTKKEMLEAYKELVKQLEERREVELKPEKEVEEKQVQRLAELKKSRDSKKVSEALNKLREAADHGKNLMPEFINCAKAYATLGEMINVLKEKYGEYVEPAEF